jgi:hypothetical protein
MVDYCDRETPVGGESYAKVMRRQSQLADQLAAELARSVLGEPQAAEEVRAQEPKPDRAWRACNFIGANPVYDLREREGHRRLSGICLAVYHSTGVSVRDLRGSKRNTNIVKARNEAYLLSFKAGYTVSQIGRYYGKDHTSIRHGIARAAGMPAPTGCKRPKGVINMWLDKVRAA